jgi:hypothetical protein
MARSLGCLIKRGFVNCVLAATHHDPDGRLIDQTKRVMPALRRLFSGIAVHATDVTDTSGLDLLAAQGARVRRAPSAGHLLLGRARRGAVEHGLGLGAPHMLFCDLDRALHWAEFYPEELAQIVGRLAEADCTVLGRTPRAYASHPHTQRDTEQIVNDVFARVSGRHWDITAAARGFSRRAAEAIVAGCHEDSVGTDGAWPLFLAGSGAFSLDYAATEGLEFETPDRFEDQVTVLGGVEAWVARLDSDVREWALRLEIAQAEVAALLPYAPQQL